MTILREENCHSVLVVNLQIDNSHASKEKSRKNLPHKTEKYMFYQNWQWRMDYQTNFQFKIFENYDSQPNLPSTPAITSEISENFSHYHLRTQRKGNNGHLYHDLERTDIQHQ